MVLNAHRNHKDCYGTGRREEGGMEVGEEGEGEQVNRVLNDHRNVRLVRDGEKGRRGYGGGGRERPYTYHYTVTTKMTPALRWAAMRAMFHYCEEQSHKTVSTDHNFWRERTAEAESNQGPSAYQPNALPLGQTGSQKGYQGTYSFKYSFYATTVMGEWHFFFFFFFFSSFFVTQRFRKNACLIWQYKTCDIAQGLTSISSNEYTDNRDKR